MATWDDVRRIAAALPEASEGTAYGQTAWRVRNTLFVWERPLRRSDRDALGEAAPGGAILGARVPDEGAKYALAADESGVYFTTPHFDGYPAILVKLDEISVDELEELITEAWLAAAPKRLATAYLTSRGSAPPSGTP